MAKNEDEILRKLLKRKAVLIEYKINITTALSKMLSDGCMITAHSYSNTLKDTDNEINSINEQITYLLNK